jgi:hypothetical protein
LLKIVACELASTFEAVALLEANEVNRFELKIPFMAYTPFVTTLFLVELSNLKAISKPATARTTTKTVKDLKKAGRRSSPSSSR